MSESTENPSRDLPATDGSPTPRFSLRSLLIGTMVICVLLAAIVPLVRHVQHVQRRAQQWQCQNNLRSIASALHCYYDVHKSLPCVITYAADGTPLHSWRVPLLPYFDYAVRWPDYDYREPWNGPNNSLSYKGLKGPWCPPCYRCPGAPPSRNGACTDYVMLIDDRPGKPNGPPHLPGSAPPSLDPKSAVIVIEIADSDIHWMKPRDVLLSELSMKINDRSKRSLSSYHGGACVVHADGSVELLDDATTEERVRELLTQ